MREPCDTIGLWLNLMHSRLARGGPWVTQFIDWPVAEPAANKLQGGLCVLTNLPRRAPQHMPQQEYPGR